MDLKRRSGAKRRGGIHCLIRPRFHWAHPSWELPRDCDCDCDWGGECSGGCGCGCGLHSMALEMGGVPNEWSGENGIHVDPGVPTGATEWLQ